MSIQKLHAFEKTSIQLRHTIKRLEVFIEVSSDPGEIEKAKKVLTLVKEARKLLPGEMQDVDLRQ